MNTISILLSAGVGVASVTAGLQYCVRVYNMHMCVHDKQASKQTELLLLFGSDFLFWMHIHEINKHHMLPWALKLLMLGTHLSPHTPYIRPFSEYHTIVYTHTVT